MRLPHPRQHRKALGGPSPGAATRWSSRPPGRARRWRPSCGRSTGSPPSRSQAIPSSAAASSTSRRSRRWPSTSSATSGPRSPASAKPHGGSDSPSQTSLSASGPATRRPMSGARFQRTPPDVLITTPESLFLILTSQARESLRGVETVIVDEVHAVAGTKRGAHLALSLERLDALLATACPAGRSLGDGPADRRGRPLPRRLASRPGRRPRQRQGVGPARRRPSRRSRRVGRARHRSRLKPRAALVHLAARRGARARPGRGAPLHHRLRQLAPPGRAAHGPAQRDLRASAPPARPCPAPASSGRPRSWLRPVRPGASTPPSPAPTTAR